MWNIKDGERTEVIRYHLSGGQGNFPQHIEALPDDYTIRQSRYQIVYLHLFNSTEDYNNYFCS